MAFEQLHETLPDRPRRTEYADPKFLFHKDSSLRAKLMISNVASEI
jgi:hypothetical protein